MPSQEKRIQISPLELLGKIKAASDIEGLSISGGEPLEQPELIADLLHMIQTEKAKEESTFRSDFSILLFSGYTLSQIQATSHGPELLDMTDILVAGPFIADKASDQHPFLGSNNQRIHFLSSRYSPKDFLNVPLAEVIIDEAGTVHLSGVRPFFDPV